MGLYTNILAPAGYLLSATADIIKAATALMKNWFFIDNLFFITHVWSK